MSQPLTVNDLIDTAKEKIYSQQYGTNDSIDGVQLLPLANHINEEGDFSEIVRIGPTGELVAVPGFQLAQVNRSKLGAHSIKAWHIHFYQDEIWYVLPDDHLVVGLWDLRKTSKTAAKSIKLSLGGGDSQLLFIPHGIAHGSVNNLKRSITLFYFTNNAFDKNHPDEQRIPWDTLGKDFWLPQRD